MCFVLLFKPSAHALSSWFWLWFVSPSAFNHHLGSLQDWFSHGDGDGCILLTFLIYVVCGHILGVVEAEKASCGSQFAGFKEFPVEMGWGKLWVPRLFLPTGTLNFCFFRIKYQFIVELGFLVWVSFFPPQPDQRKEQGKNRPGHKNSGNDFEIKAAKIEDN